MTKNKDALRAAIKQADFESVRGNFSFNNNHYPIQDFHSLNVVKRSMVVPHPSSKCGERLQGQLRGQVQDVIFDEPQLLAGAQFNPPCHTLYSSFYV